MRQLLDPPELLGKRVRVETMMELLVAALQSLECEIPRAADGVDQLVRRQTSCDWLGGIPSSERTSRVLGDSLRMLRNVALFANAAAEAAGFERWHVEPRDDLPGGRIVVALGENVASPELVRAMAAAAREGKADPVDCLVCVPHSGVVRDADGRRHARFAEVVAAAGGRAWDGSDPRTRGTDPTDKDLWRIVQYDSCRGLEGWITLALDLDDFYANRLRHPNFHRDDLQGDPQTVTRRWLMIPLTRAVHTLVVTIRDPESPVAAILRAGRWTSPRWSDAQTPSRRNFFYQKPQFTRGLFPVNGRTHPSRLRNWL